MPKAICQSHRGCYECLPTGDTEHGILWQAETVALRDGDRNHPYVKIIGGLLQEIDRLMLFIENDECPLCSTPDSLVQEWLSKARAVAKSKGLLK